MRLEFAPWPNRITLIPGDGIGPELAEATRRVLDASGVDVRLGGRRGRRGRHGEGRDAAAGVTSSTRSGATRSPSRARSRRRSARASAPSTLRSARRSACTPTSGRSVRSKGLETRYDERRPRDRPREHRRPVRGHRASWSAADAAESIKIITREASERIARFAFEYAVANGRRKVTAVHKANIMKLSDGLFLESCRTVAAGVRGPRRLRGPHRRQHVHAARPEARAVRRARPARTSTATSSATSAPGSSAASASRPGANIGTEAAVFEPVHGSAPKYAGQNKANPTALILSRRPDAPPPRRASPPRSGSRPPCATVIAEGTHGDLRPRRDCRDERVRRRDRRPSRAGGDRRPDRPRALTASGLGARRGFGRRFGRLHAALRYRGTEGMLAWAFHRISGVAIWAFVLLHVFDIYLVRRQPQGLRRHPQVLRQPARPDRARSLLGAALLYHALNGLRIIIMDFWPATDRLPQAALVRRTG